MQSGNNNSTPKGNTLGRDLSAGLVVFLVALPLCLGIALASGAPLFSGIIAGICGGIVVGLVSKSNLGVSGPAAGLTVIVLNAITEIGVFEAFLLSVVLAGVLQIILGLLGAGKIAFFFPSSVIKGMLAAIGVLIILKQIPHALGVDKNPEGNETFIQPDGQNTFTEFFNIPTMFVEGAMIIGLVSLVVLILWEKIGKKVKALAAIPGPLIAVVLGVAMNELFPASLKISSTHLVGLPISDSFSEISTLFKLPDFTAISNPLVWKSAIVLAIIASLETLLCVEATDRLDPERTVTPTNRELIAQGAGNIASGLLGGIPVTQVIVRSSANIQAGGKSKKATIFHGILLLVSALTIPQLINKIPLAALAAVLIMVGYKLAKPALFKSVYKEGQDQFIPFIVTIIGVVFTDLLTGILIGLAVGLAYVLFTNFRSAIDSHYQDGQLHLDFQKDVFFYNRAEVLNSLSKLKSGDKVVIDGRKANFIDHDIFLLLEEFLEEAPKNNIQLQLVDITRKKINFIKDNEIISKTLRS